MNRVYIGAVEGNSVARVMIVNALNRMVSGVDSVVMKKVGKYVGRGEKYVSRFSCSSSSSNAESSKSCREHC